DECACSLRLESATILLSKQVDKFLVPGASPAARIHVLHNVQRYVVLGCEARDVIGPWSLVHTCPTARNEPWSAARVGFTLREVGRLLDSSSSAPVWLDLA